MVQVRWTIGAASDLEEIADFLDVSSSAAASALVQRVLTAAASLEDQPRMGRVVPEYEMEWLREVIVRDYRVIYLLGADDESVRVYAIQHARRDIRRHLGDQPWETS